MRRLPRFYAAFEAETDQVQLSAEQTHHVVHVLRMKPGDRLLIFNETAGEWEAVLDVHHGGCWARKGKCVRQAEVRFTQSWLAFSPLKPHLTHFVVEKATELDVTHIQPIIMARTQGQSWSRHKWQRVAEEAAQQCERLDVPEIHEPVSLKDFIEHLPPVQWLAALERSESSVTPQPAGDWGIIIGPEGGFTAEERATLRQKTQPLSLGRNILRAETAAIAGIGVLATRRTTLAV